MFQLRVDSGSGVYWTDRFPIKMLPGVFAQYVEDFGYTVLAVSLHE